jgi:hypothetical protein
MEPALLVSHIDHLVYVTPDLDQGIGEIESLTGIRATSGGPHPGRGTRNALVGFGPKSYLEIMAPDPEQPEPSEPRPFGMDLQLKVSRLAAWFIKGEDLQQLRERAIRNGVPLGEVKSGRRRRPDGVQLSWHFTDPWAPVADGVIPLFIDWGTSPHPAVTAAGGVSLVGLRAHHPEAARVQHMLRQLEIGLPVEHGERPALFATLETSRGRVELR